MLTLEMVNQSRLGPAELSFEELAAVQGTQPITEFDAFIGHPADEDECTEEFAAMLREWRREGAASPRSQ